MIALFTWKLNKQLVVHVFEQMEEVIEDIISMQSSYDDIKNYIDPVVHMPNTVSKVTDSGFFCLLFLGVFFVYTLSHAHIFICLTLL